jgi:rod shape-determining protein MreC
MEGFLNRYRNITVLLLVIFAQLLLLAVQVKNGQDVPMIRVWTVTAVTPVARVVEGLRGGSLGFFRNYITLHNASVENGRLREENGRLKLENIFLKNELNRADRAKALEMFQAKTPSKMVAATVIAAGAGSRAKVVFVDRGTVSGIMRGMPVVTPDGIVGIVRAAYPTASEILLVTDPDFAAGAIDQKTMVRGTVKGQGTPMCRLDYVPSEAPIQPGDWLYTSGEDHVFPRGFAIGVVKSVKPGQPFKDVTLEPTGTQQGLGDVLILVEGTHHEIPDTPPTNQPVYISPLAPAGNPASPESPSGAPHQAATEADKLRSAYKAVGEAQNYTFGDGGVGSRPADFTKLGTVGVSGATGSTSAQHGAGDPRPPASGVTGSTSAPRGIAEPGPAGTGAATGAASPAVLPPPRAATGSRGATGSTGVPRAPDAVRKPGPAPGGPGGAARQ